MSMKEGINNAKVAFIGLGVIALIGFILLIIFGNLEGNDGFAENSQGANNTAQVIGNFTDGLVAFFSFQTVIFILLAIAVLVAVAFGLIRFMSRDTGGFTN